MTDQSLKHKIEWMLNGGFLTDKGDNKKFAYGLDLNTKMFYGINKASVKAKKPMRIIQDQHMPLEDIDQNMEIMTL